MKKSLILSLLICISFVSLSQTSLSLISVDTKTYQQWLESDWDGLISYGNEALNEGVDFYYLRVRLGIAYYNKKNFHEALDHFKEAMKFNSSEDFLKEYLFFSYVFSGQKVEADIFAAGFSPELKKRIGYSSRKGINNISTFYSWSYNPNPSIAEDFTYNESSRNNGYQDINQFVGVSNIKFSHQITNRLSLSHSYTNVMKSSYRFGIWNNFETVEKEQSTTLHQYYLSASIWAARGFNFIVGGHYIHIRYPVKFISYGMGQPQTKTKINTENDYVGFLSVYKNLKYYTFGASFYYSQLTPSTQLQGDILLTYYPLGNLNIYSTTTATYQREISSSSTFENSVVIEQLVGIKAHKVLWVEGFFSFGDMHNFIKNDGFSVYNSTHYIKSRFGGRFIFLASNKFRLSLTYTHFKNASYYTETQNSLSKLNPVNYSNHSLTGGMSWNF